VRAAFDVLQRVAIPEAASALDARIAELKPDFELSALLHEHGVNVRYLRDVAAHCREPASRRFIAQELIIRAAKRGVRAMWTNLARSEAHAAALGQDVIEQLATGRAAWADLVARELTSGGEPLPDVLDLQQLPPRWAWEQRLRAALCMRKEFRVISACHFHFVFFEVPLLADTLECCSSEDVRARRCRSRPLSLRSSRRTQCPLDKSDRELPPKHFKGSPSDVQRSASYGRCSMCAHVLCPRCVGMYREHKSPKARVILAPACSTCMGAAYRCAQTVVRPKVKGVRLPAPVAPDRQESALLARLEKFRAAGADQDTVATQLQLVALYQIWAAGGMFAAAFAKGDKLVAELMEFHRLGPAAERARVLAAAADWYRQYGFYQRADLLFREMIATQRAQAAATSTRGAQLALAATLLSHSETLEVRP
jgi:hypothetical protein